MKLINIALLSTALAAGLFSTSMPSYADEAVVGIVDTSVQEVQNAVDPLPMEIVDHALDKPDIPDENETVDTTDDVVEEPVVVDDTGFVEKPETIDDPVMMELSYSTSGEEPLIMSAGPRGIQANERSLTDRGADIADEGVQLVDNSSHSNGATNANDGKPSCKLGFFKCLFGTK